MLVSQIINEERFIIHQTLTFDKGQPVYRIYDIENKNYISKEFVGDEGKIEAKNLIKTANAEDKNQKKRFKDTKKKKYNDKDQQQDKDKYKKQKQKDKEKLKKAKRNAVEKTRKWSKSWFGGWLFKLAITVPAADDVITYSRRYIIAYELNGCSEKLNRNNISPYTGRPVAVDIAYFRKKIDESVELLIDRLVTALFMGSGGYITASILAPIIVGLAPTVGAAALITALVALAGGYLTGEAVKSVFSAADFKAPIEDWCKTAVYSSLSLMDDCSLISGIGNMIPFGEGKETAALLESKQKELLALVPEDDRWVIDKLTTFLRMVRNLDIERITSTLQKFFPNIK
jgi:hypothetical protein